MRHDRERLAAVIAVCAYVFCACSGVCAAGKEMKNEKVEVFHASTPMEYSTAVSELVKEADTMVISKNEGKYKSARLLIKSNEALDFSSYEGVCKVIADSEGHYTAQFLSSESAKKASEALNGLKSVQYVEPDGIMTGEND